MDKAELINQTIALSKRLGQAQMRYAFEPWRKLDVPLAQLKSLFLIHIKGRLTVRHLALNLGVTPANVTSIVDRLVGQGLVKRSEDPKDRRLVLLELTDEGRKTIMDIHDTGMSHMKNILQRMSMDDIAALYRGIGSLLAIVEEDNKALASDQNKPEGFAGPSPTPSTGAASLMTTSLKQR